MNHLGTVTVGPTSIAKGRRKDPNRCPVACALREYFTDAFIVYVQGYSDIQCMGVHWSAQIQSPKARLSFDIPPDVVKKINDFDRTGVMEPFTFPICI